MRKIWKYALDVHKMTSLNLPIDARIVHFGFQGSHFIPFVWVLFRTDVVQKELRAFDVIPTGVEVLPMHKHISTAFSDADEVWHLFERIGF